MFALGWGGSTDKEKATAHLNYASKTGLNELRSDLKQTLMEENNWSYWIKETCRKGYHSSIFD